MHARSLSQLASQQSDHTLYWHSAELHVVQYPQPQVPPGQELLPVSISQEMLLLCWQGLDVCAPATSVPKPALRGPASASPMPPAPIVPRNDRREKRLASSLVKRSPRRSARVSCPLLFIVTSLLSPSRMQRRRRDALVR